MSGTGAWVARRKDTTPNSPKWTLGGRYADVLSSGAASALGEGASSSRCKDLCSCILGSGAGHDCFSENLFVNPKALREGDELKDAHPP